MFTNRIILKLRLGHKMAFNVKCIQRFVQIFWIIALVGSETVRGTQCGRLQIDFFAVENRALGCCTYQEMTAHSPVICVSYCHSNKYCQSVNYYRMNNSCELNNATRFQYPDEFVVVNGSVYFDGDRIQLSERPSCAYQSSVHPSSGSSTSQASEPTMSDSSVPSASQEPATSIKNSSCATAQDVGQDSGVSTIYPPSFHNGLQVYCDTETDGGGWIVIQRRQDGSISFIRNWVEFETFFGDLTGEFWLGNNVLRALTSSQTWQLRVDLEDWDGATAWAEYAEFSVTGELYTLHVGSCNGTAGDSLQHHDGIPFTTIDADNDNHTENCADASGGGWWYNKCQKANLNGKYFPYGKGAGVKDGIQWKAWKGNNYSLKKCSMKIRAIM